MVSASRTFLSQSDCQRDEQKSGKHTANWELLLINTFRVVSLLEGFSYLAILSVSLGLLDRSFVFQLGMLHGVLFLTYMIVSLVVCSKQNWSLTIWLPLFLASLVPFAFIPVEMYLRKALVSPVPATA